MTQFFKPVRLSTCISTGIFLLRIVAGLAFMFHGFSKIQHPFDWMGAQATMHGSLQVLAALSEFVGGLFWILGLLTPVASIGLACTMSVAVWMHAQLMRDPFVASKEGEGSYEIALIYLCVAVLFLFAGPGKFSLDRVIFGEKS